MHVVESLICWNYDSSFIKFYFHLSYHENTVLRTYVPMRKYYFLCVCVCAIINVAFLKSHPTFVNSQFSAFSPLQNTAHTINVLIKLCRLRSVSKCKNNFKSWHISLKPVTFASNYSQLNRLAVLLHLLVQ